MITYLFFNDFIIITFNSKHLVDVLVLPSVGKSWDKRVILIFITLHVRIQMGFVMLPFWDFIL